MLSFTKLKKSIKNYLFGIHLRHTNFSSCSWGDRIHRWPTTTGQDFLHFRFWERHCWRIQQRVGWISIIRFIDVSEIATHSNPKILLPNCFSNWSEVIINSYWKKNNLKTITRIKSALPLAIILYKEKEIKM